MKIIDRDSDYYDYLASWYGVDNRIVYHREKKIDIKGIIGPVPDAVSKKIEELRAWEQWYLNKHNSWGGNENVPDNAERMSFWWLNICGLVIPLKTVKPQARNTWEPDYFNGQLVNQTSVMGVGEVWKRSGWLSSPIESFTDESIMNLIGEPVFVFKPGYVREHCKIDIEAIQIPKLRAIKGLHQYITPEQVFQQIELYLGKKRDTMPEPVVPNDIKIQQAGFDLKQSFRKRK